MSDAKPKTNLCLDGKFYIHGLFDDDMIEAIVPQLVKSVEEESKKKEGKIEFYIDSRGGFVNHLFTLLGLIEKAKRNGVIVQTHVMAHAYSCGSLLAASGTKGHRLIHELSEHLCHLGTASWGYVINDVELKRSSLRAEAHFKQVRRLYKKYAKIKDLEKAIRFDNMFFRGKEIIDNGLADGYFA